MTIRTPPIEDHPDLASLRLRYEEAAETPTAQVVEGLTFLAGLYLAISPWVVGFTSHSSLTASNVFTGVALAVLALCYATMYGRSHRIAWVAPIVSAWAIVAPWLVSGPAPSVGAIVSNVIVGLVGLACTIAMMSVGRRSAARPAGLGMSSAGPLREGRAP
ncbi:SPW repeat protein [Catellatospora tritici]|uniref:SPW repeat protein n=1 Tax=Catellatospora tritici TaxID=2851566 RepID=UPI001C2D4338|nr:SPW repeat protein [Catellatospora tritici]MBV1856718.1 SPW repeat protein [Catellatospora tritici]